MTIGFIGLGNMASAIIGGILRKKIAAPSDIIGSDALPAAAKKAADSFGIGICSSNSEVAAKADCLFLAVKPQYAEDVISGISRDIPDGRLVVSIIAGKTISWLSERLEKGGSKVRIVRVMPNTPALVGEGCSGVCRQDSVTDSEFDKVMEIISSFGTASEVTEKMIDVVGAVSGSSPAFTFMYIEALADAAVLSGMARSDAYKFAAQSVLGSAKLVLESGRHPGELKDMVCSPGGTTIEGVKVLEESGFRGAVIDAIQAVMDKTARL